MLLKHYFSAVCISLACFTQPVEMVISAPVNSLAALSSTDIRQKASQFVVRIDGAIKDKKTGEIRQNPGSGFIINRNGNTYTVLTAAHVVDNSISQYLITTDGKKYSFNPKNIKIIPKVDLAEINFVSNVPYNLAKLSTNSNNTLGSSVYVYGWSEIKPPIYQVRKEKFSPGVISQILPIESSYRGYSMVFNFPVVQGVSGSPVLDENGEVIGIYGLTDEDNYTSTFGIPIASYQDYQKLIQFSLKNNSDKNLVCEHLSSKNNYSYFVSISGKTQRDFSSYPGLHMRCKLMQNQRNITMFTYLEFASSGIYSFYNVDVPCEKCATQNPLRPVTLVVYPNGKLFYTSLD
jgi:S1-C subfamily serine protease